MCRRTWTRKLRSRQRRTVVTRGARLRLCGPRDAVEASRARVGCRGVLHTEVASRANVCDTYSDSNQLKSEATQQERGRGPYDDCATITAETTYHSRKGSCLWRCFESWCNNDDDTTSSISLGFDTKHRQPCVRSCKVLPSTTVESLTCSDASIRTWRQGMATRRKSPQDSSGQLA